MHSAKMTFLDSTFLDYARDLYMRNNLPHGGYFEMLNSGWRRRDHPNMLMLWYEEMKEDQRHCVLRMMEHIGVSLPEDKVTELCEAMAFSNYRKISSRNQSKEPNSDSVQTFSFCFFRILEASSPGRELWETGSTTSTRTSTKAGMTG